MKSWIDPRGRDFALTIIVMAALALLPAASASARTGDGLSARLSELARPSLHTAPRAEQARKLSLAEKGAGSLLRLGDRILVDVRFDHGALPAADLRAVGASVLNTSIPYRTVTIAVRPERLRQIERVPGVEAVTEVLAPQVLAADGAGPVASPVECSGAATSEGDTHLRALEARQAFGVDGTGATVGILSDSFDTATGAGGADDDVQSGDLPGASNPCGRIEPVAELEDFPSGSDEGRAMAQIVHDLAPGARLAFATAFTGELAFAENIERLAKPVAQGGAAADVIVDDVFYFFEPFFQEGPIAVAADNVTAGGAAYFSAAGNDNLIDASGRDIASWEAPSFRDATSCPSELGASADRERCMDFNPGAGSDSTFGLTVEPGEPLTVSLQWAEPWNGVTTDLDVVLLNSSGKPIKVSGSTVGGFEDNVGVSQKPVEIFDWTNPSSKDPAQVQMAVVRCFAGCNPDASPSTMPRLKLALLQNGFGVSSTEYPQSSGGDVVGPTIFGHAAAESAISVGAVAYDTTSEPEEYSSRGPAVHYFGPVEGSTPAPPLGTPQTLAKPDVVATDGGANTFFGSLLSGTWRFFGTSAAAPHAAAVAALMRDADSETTPAELRSALAATARPVGSFGPDAVGAGLIDAMEAVDEFADEPPPDETPPQTTIDSGPSGLTNDATPTFEFSADESASFECRLDGQGSFAACTTPHTTTTLGQGAHTFEVRAKDAAGNTDATPASRGFTVDTQAPQTTIDSGPTGPTVDATPTFGFSANEAGSTFECRLDGEGSFGSCASPHTTPTLALGAHTFEARAKDAAGNTDATPASRSFSVVTTPPVDETPPETTIDSGPSGPTNDATPTFAFSADETASFECRLDEAGAFADCTSPYTPEALPDGARTFEVRAIDEAENIDPTPDTRSFRVDTRAPQTTIDSGPSGPTNDATPTFAFSADETASFECRLDEAGAFADCTSPYTPEALPDGAHTFEVRAIDEAENTDPTPGKSSFVVQTAPSTTDPAPSPEAGAILPPPVFFDVVPPRCSFSAGRAAPAGRPIAVRTGCDEVVTATAIGRIVAVRGNRRRIRFGLRRAAAAIPAGRMATLRLRPKSGKAARRLKRLIGRRWKGRAVLRVRYVDRSGNAATERPRLKLKR